MQIDPDLVQKLARAFKEIVITPINDKYKRATALYGVYLTSQFKLPEGVSCYPFTVVDLEKVFLAEAEIRTILLGKEPEIPRVSEHALYSILSIIYSLVNDVRNALISDTKMNNEVLKENEARKIFVIFQQLVRDLKLTHPIETPRG